MQFNQLRDIGFAYWQDAKKNNRAPITSLLVLGPPGTGKSSCGREIANKIGLSMAKTAVIEKSDTVVTPTGEGRVLAVHADSVEVQIPGKPDPVKVTRSSVSLPVVDLKRTPNFNGDVTKHVLFYAGDLSSSLPEDIGGVPKPAVTDVCGTSMMVTTYSPQRWLAPFCVPGAVGVLCLDDLPAAAPAVAVAVRQLVLDRRVGQMVLSDGVLIFVTGNRREDKAGASTLPSHFLNAVTSYRIEPELPPTTIGADGGSWKWEEWYANNGGNPLVPAFLRFKPSCFSTLPKEADKDGCFATPRSWAFLGQQFDVAEKMGLLRETAIGLVGEGRGNEFMAFVAINSQLVDPATVLADPIKAVPDPRKMFDSIDKLIAITTGIGELAGRTMKSDNVKAKKEMPLQFLRATGHVTTGSREYIATAVSSFTSNGGNIAQLIATARANATDPHVRAVVLFLQGTFGIKQ